MNPREHELSDEEEQLYLRSTPIIPVQQNIREMASQITEGAQEIKEKLRLLFIYIIKHFKYKFPPKARGVTHFLKDKQGDCGEFSFLYAALCRAIGVPCRVMVGAFAMGKHHAHVWNEVYLPEEGWMPVDVSMAYVVKKQPWRFFSLP